jgi:hypothetical protein
MIPLGSRQCTEKYMAIAPSQSANAGFAPRGVFITEGQYIFKFSGGTITFFAQVECFFSDHSSNYTGSYSGTDAVDRVQIDEARAKRRPGKTRKRACSRPVALRGSENY